MEGQQIFQAEVEKQIGVLVMQIIQKDAMIRTLDAEVKRLREKYEPQTPFVSGDLHESNPS